MSERIVAAAVKRDGIIYTMPPPARHHTIMQAVDKNHGQHHLPFLPDEQGFLTSTGRFMGRIGAAAMAKDNGQITATKWGQELYSEDLW